MPSKGLGLSHPGIYRAEEDSTGFKTLMTWLTWRSPMRYRVSLASFVLFALVAIPSAALADHWRHHEGRWNLWNDGDQRWYHTDGRDWYYHDKGRWNQYRFDGKFGHDGFGDLSHYRQGLDAHHPTPPTHHIPPHHDD